MTFGGETHQKPNHTKSTNITIACILQSILHLKNKFVKHICQNKLSSGNAAKWYKRTTIILYSHFTGASNV